MESLNNSQSQTLDDHAFIELVKDCIGSAHILPIMTLLHEGENTQEKIQNSLSHLPEEELQTSLDKMIKFAIVQRLNNTTQGGPGAAWFLTPVGQEFRLILQDIERLKHKYTS
ncbi:hypothetical protein [Planctobacterium marinum]|uniref:hypothetical protein n=1 Tax=Planctobacterium marinum TaxID=1631968 RepID=UPI0030C6876E